MATRRGNAAKNVVLLVVALGIFGAAGFVYMQRQSAQKLLDREVELREQGQSHRLMLANKFREQGQRFVLVSVHVQVDEGSSPVTALMTFSGSVANEKDLADLKQLVASSNPPMPTQFDVKIAPPESVTAPAAPSPG